MDVVCKMKCTSVSKTGDPTKPYIRIELGAVCSMDPESENRSFANATPTASMALSIDPGRPAAAAFELGGEYLITLRPCGVPARVYLKDSMPPADSVIVLSKRDGSGETTAVWKDQRTLTVKVDGEEISCGWGFEKIMAAGFTHWRYLRDGEVQ